MLRLALGWLFLSFLALSACQTPSLPDSTAEDACEKTRAALDVGSGSTKLKVARVDVCEFRVKEILFEDQEKVSYQDDLQQSPDASLSKAVLAQGLSAVRRLKEKAERFNPDGIIGVATSAFRKAKNGQEAAESIGRQAGLTIQVVTQEEEGHLGFFGATKGARGPLAKLAVWDVGGGSQQITTRDEGGRFQVFESQLASVTFKEEFVSGIQRRKKGDSPNPISHAEAKAGMDHVRRQLRDVPPGLKAFLSASDTEVVGIGGVHFHSLSGQVGARVYDSTILQTTLAKKLGLTDAQIGGDFAATDVSNIILIAGAMEAFGIQKVTAANVNLAEGAMLHPRFWPK